MTRMRYRRRSKYNAKRTELDGYKFDSLAEARHYSDLLVRKAAGEIHGDIEVHPVYPIVVNGHPVCRVELDFRYRDTAGKEHVVDIKGRDLPMSKLKRKLLFAAHGVSVAVIR